jgi:hypothetical protein
MSNKRARTDSGGQTADAIKQVGQGLEVTVPRSIPHGYNDSYTVRLTYADTLRHDVSYGGVGKHLYRMSLWDPDFTGTGHQAHMRDLWASQYDYYTVLSAEYEMHFYNGGVGSVTYTSVGSSNQRLGCVQVHFNHSTNSNDFPTAVTPYPIAEMKNCRTKFLIPEETCSFQGTLTPGDFMVDAVDADNDETWIPVGSNPTINRFFGYVITPTLPAAISGQSTAHVSAIQVYLKIHYTVQFTQVNASLRQTPS